MLELLIKLARVLTQVSKITGVSTDINIKEQTGILSFSYNNKKYEIHSEDIYEIA